MTQSLYDYLEDKYPNHTPADARFKNEEAEPPAFSLAVSNPQWKFSYNTPDGPPILGRLFYNDNVFDGEHPLLSKDTPTKAKFFVDQRREDHTLFVYVQFFAPGSNTELLGEFLAQDSYNVAAASGLLHNKKEGEWQFLTDDTLHDRLKKKYHDQKVDGNVLLPGSTSFKFESDELGWQFVRADPGYGPGLDGTLFYNDNVFDGPHPILSKDHPTKADFYVKSVTDKGTLYVLVQFHVPGSQNDDQFLGEFLAKDPSNEASASGLLNKVENGEWSFVGTDSLLNRLKGKYKYPVLADAFFLKEGHTSSFLLEVFRSHREFYDGRVVGHHVGGTFFHNDSQIIGSNPQALRDEKITTDYYVRRVKEKEVLYIHVLFFKPESSQTGGILYEFLGRDPYDTASSSASLYQRKTGTWDIQPYIGKEVHVINDTQATRVDIKDDDNTIGTIDYERGDKTFKHSFDTSGLLSYKHVPGKYAKWYKDRFVLYDTVDSHDFTGFFFVTDDEGTIGYKDGASFEVTWTSDE